MPDAAGPGAAPEWFDAQYNNRARIPEHLDILQSGTSARTMRAPACPARSTSPTAARRGERLDIFTPDAPGAPVLVYIHGGYWRALDKRDQSLRRAALRRRRGDGRAAELRALPGGRHQAHRAAAGAIAGLGWRHAREHGGDPQRIVVAGHSAGGHLAAMMLACNWPAVAPDLPADLVRAALAVSGVFELEPLRHAPFLASDLNLDAASARKLSPALMPAPRDRLVAVVGADESEEFLRQNAAIAAAWGSRAVPVCEEVPGRHHMNVLHELAEPSSRTHRLALQLLGL